MQRVSYLCLFCECPFISDDEKEVGKKWMSEIVAFVGGKVLTGSYDSKGRIKVSDKEKILLMDENTMFHKHCYKLCGKPNQGDPNFSQHNKRDPMRGLIIPSTGKPNNKYTNTSGIKFDREDLIKYLSKMDSSLLKHRIYQAKDKFKEHSIDCERQSKNEMIKLMKEKKIDRDLLLMIMSPEDLCGVIAMKDEEASPEEVVTPKDQKEISKPIGLPEESKPLKKEKTVKVEFKEPTKSHKSKRDRDNSI